MPMFWLDVFVTCVAATNFLLAILWLEKRRWLLAISNAVAGAAALTILF
jgi:hypothetical protein